MFFHYSNSRLALARGFLWAFSYVLPMLASSAALAAIEITDISGRVVTLEAPAHRLVIDDGRLLIALALISADPVGLVAAWPHDVNRLGEKTYEAYRAHSPAIETLPKIANSAESFALEPIVAAKPDVALFTAGTGPTAEQVAQMEALGIRVVFIDFFAHPFQNAEPSLAILGKVIGREDAAKAFVNFRQAHLGHIRDVLAKAGDFARPNVFLEVHAGMSEDCCNSPGKGNVGDYVELVGGHNIGADVLSGPSGRLNLEYVIARNPDLYIATGGPHFAKTGGFVLGPGYDAAAAKASLAKIAARPGIASLEAVKQRRVFGLMHQLLNSPIDLVAAEVLASFIHPELFSAADAQKTLDELNQKFLAVPVTGTLWTGLADAAPPPAAAKASGDAEAKCDH